MALENSKKKSSWGGARKNSGRPAGSQNKATIEERAAFGLFKQRVLERVLPIFHAQYLQALGTTHLFRVDENKKTGRKEHVLVTSASEIARFLDARGEDGAGEVDDHYYYISTKDPDNSALNSLLDRAFGRPMQTHGGHDGGPIQQVVTIMKYAKEGK